MQLQTTRSFDAKGCRVDLSTWGNNLTIKDETDAVTFTNVSQEELRDAIRGYISSFRYSSQDNSIVDEWLQQLTSTVADAIKERQDRKAKESAA
jgi:sRNA-binding protein|tara:strand:+ start:346 stop:627 length:282 start_codon:yes stop_codon:yes gene_type:complete